MNIGSRLTNLTHLNRAFAWNTYPLLTAINVDAENPAFSSENGVLFNKDKTELIRFPRGKQGAYSIPKSVTSIGIGAFQNSSLTSVIIPENVTSIGNNAFRNIVLSDIYVHWETPPNINANVFGSIILRNIALHIPHGTLSTYQNAPVWRDFILVERGETSVGIILGSREIALPAAYML